MSRGDVSLVRWLGNNAPPLNPSAMQFRAAPAGKTSGNCAGCCFRGQKADVCQAAGIAAQLAGMPDCEAKDETGRTFVYVLLKLDPRQLPIPGAAQTNRGMI